MRLVQKAIIQTAMLAIASSAWAVDGDGFKARSDDLLWARWQGRLSLGTVTPAQFSSKLVEVQSAGLRVSGLSLAGDYYFTGSLFDRVSLGGLRATSGLIVGPRVHASAGQPSLGAQGSYFSIERRLLAAPATVADSSGELASIPYLGLGYTGLSIRGRWSFSADLGLVALAPGNAVRLGRVVGGSQTLDEMLRDMRLAPVLQMGVSYSF